MFGLATAVSLVLAWQFRGTASGTDPQHLLEASQPNAASDTPPGVVVGTMGMMLRSMPAGIPASELPDPESPGASLIARYCSQCHEIPSPASHSPADRVPTLRRMVARMQHMAHMGT